MGRSIRLRHTEGIGRRSPWCVDSFPVRCLASFAGNVKRAMPAFSFSLASCPNRTSFLFLEQPENALPLRFRGYGLKQLLIMFDVETMDESLHTNLSCRCRPVETKIRRLTTLAWLGVPLPVVRRLGAACRSRPTHVAKLGPVGIQGVAESALQVANRFREVLPHATLPDIQPPSASPAHNFLSLVTIAS